MKELSQKAKALEYRVWLSIIFSTAVLVALTYFTDIEKVFNTIRNGRLDLIFLALVTSNIPILVYAFTWKEVFNVSGIEISYFNSFRIVLANVFINNITPFGNIGGEAAATYLIAKVTDYRSEKILSSVLMASIINFAPLGSILIIGLFLMGQGPLLAISAISLFLVLFFRKKMPPILFLTNLLSQRVVKKILSSFREFIKSLKTLMNHKLKLLVLLGFTHSAILFDVVSVVIVAKAFGGDLLTPLILIMVPLARVANYFPTPGGSGSYEAMMVALLTVYMNLNTAVAVSTVVTYRSITYYIGLLAGYVALNSIGMDANFLAKHGVDTNQ